jgi:hypothetical protein
MSSGSRLTSFGASSSAIADVYARTAGARVRSRTAEATHERPPRTIPPAAVLFLN